MHSCHVNFSCVVMPLHMSLYVVVCRCMSLYVVVCRCIYVNAYMSMHESLHKSLHKSLHMSLHTSHARVNAQVIARVSARVNARVTFVQCAMPPIKNASCHIHLPCGVMSLVESCHLWSHVTCHRHVTYICIMQRVMSHTYASCRESCHT